MNLKTLTIKHLRLISLYWSKYVVRSGSGLVYLLIALVFGLSVAHILIMPVEQLMVQQKRTMGHTDPEIIRNTIIRIGQPIAQWVLGQKTMKEIIEENAAQQRAYPAPERYRADMNNPDETSIAGQMQIDMNFDPWTRFLLEERPALLSAIFLVLIFGMPFVISFLAYNQISGDVQSHGLRYLLLRTERSNIYFGRFLGAVLFSTIVIATIVATITFYLGVKTRIYPALALTGWAACGFLALSVLMVPYIALCSMISASVDSPFLSLVLAKVIITGVLLLAIAGSMAWKPAKYLLYALPWGWQSHLLDPAPSHWLGAVFACFAYTVVFLMLGYYRFEKRDI
jgi:ABC-type transport system involved in multi-copper enzyme maturation permease subunit